MAHIFVLKAISFCISVYMFLLFIRIICSWFKPSVDGKIWNYLCLITGPYLALFKGIKILRKGVVDFTPLLAISVLGFCSQILEMIILHFETGSRFSIFILFSYLISAVWSIISAVILFFGVLCIIRLIIIVFHMKTNQLFLNALDLALQPIVSAVMKIIQKKLSYVQLIFVTLLFLAALWLLGSSLFNFLARMLYEFKM